MLDIMRRCLNGWKARYLSKGGRLTLIKASLANIPIHHMSLFEMLVSVCKKMEQLQWDFLWKGGKEDKVMHLVAWDKVCTLKRLGGVGRRRLHFMNRALLCKWLWRYDIEEGSL